MTVVIDASVAVKWLFDESGSGSEVAAAFLLHPLIAPPVFRLECANAVIRRLRLGQINSREAHLLAVEVAAMPVILRAVSDEDTIELALRLTHFVHDCAYLALARTADVQLVTADRRFMHAANAAGFGSRVLLLDMSQP